MGTYDAQDRLMTYAGRTYTYTLAGSLASVTYSNATTTYTYDALGGLRQVVKSNGDEFQYIVDGAGRRVWKLHNGTRVQGFVYADALRPVAELDGAGNILARFIYGRHINVPDLMIKNGTTYRIVTDHLGSPRFVVDIATGAIAQTMTYDEFGRVLSDSAPGFQPFGFAGGIFDRDTELVRFGARDYDAFTGRWTAKDPILWAGGQGNLYAYVGNDPVNRIDFSGRIAFPVIVGVAVAVGAGVGYLINTYRNASNIYDASANEATRLFPGCMHNGNGDAYKHCLASCESAKQFGRTTAEGLGIVNELKGSWGGQPEEECAMDLNNNDEGFDAAEEGGDCRSKCIDALINHSLIVFDEPNLGCAPEGAFP